MNIDPTKLTSWYVIEAEFLLLTKYLWEQEDMYDQTRDEMIRSIKVLTEAALEWQQLAFALSAYSRSQTNVDN